MTIYLASVDVRASDHDYSTLYAHLHAIEAHQAQSSAWLIESRESLRGLSDQLLRFLDKNNSLFVIEIAPTTA